jgi:hypothetical protein
MSDSVPANHYNLRNKCALLRKPCRLLWKEAFLIVLNALVLLPVLGAPALFTRGEGREALVALDMVERGAIILPRGYGDAIPSKPLLLHWLIALSAQLFGMNEFSCRLPSALSAILFIAIMFSVVKRFRGNKTAITSVGILFFCGEWIRSATTCRVDMVHSAPLAAAWLGYFYARHQENNMPNFSYLKRTLYVLGTVGVLLSFLAKGPVAVILTVCVIGSWELLQTKGKAVRWKESFSLFFYYAIAPTLIASLWYFLAWWQGGEQFTAKFVEENLARFSGNMKEPAHEHGILYLIGVTCAGFLPWSLFLLPLAWWYGRNKFLYTLLPLKDSFLQFCLMVGVIVFAFYSLPSSKRGVYLLVSYPFWVIVGTELAKPVSKQVLQLAITFYRMFCRLLVVVYLLVGVALFISSIAGVPYASGTWLRFPIFIDYFLKELSWKGHTLFWLPLVCAVTTLWSLSRISDFFESSFQRGYFISQNDSEDNKVEFKYFGIVGMFIALYLCVQGAILPVVAQQKSLMSFAPVLKSYVGDDKVVSFRDSFYTLSYYSKNKMTQRENNFYDEEWVVMKRSNLNSFEKKLGAGQVFTALAADPPSFKAGAEVLLGKVERREKENKSTTKDPIKY